jgi:uncharacterized protein (DUF58 family)
MPAALLAPYLSGLGQLLIIAAVIAGLAAVADMVNCIRCGRRLKLNSQEVTRCSQFRSGEVLFLFENPLLKDLYIENFCPCLPEYLHAEAVPDMIRIRPDSVSTLPVKCRPSHRGSFSYDYSLFEVISPWKLWSYRGRIKPTGEIRVYPDVFTEQKKLAALFLNRGLSGLHVQRIAGQGREFERLRDYVPGDSFDIISWKPTARKGRPVSKVFQIENTQSVYAVIDASRFSTVEKDGKTNLDHYLASALILGAVAEKQKDKFGVIAFDSQIRAFVPAMSGAMAAKSCRDAVYSVKSRCVSPDYNTLFSFIRAKIPRRSLLFFLTDLSDAIPCEEFQRDIKLLTRKHLCCVEMLTHDGIKPLFSDPVSDKDELYTILGGHIKWADLESARQSLSRHGVRLGTSSRNSLSLNLINSYLNIKRKQLL